MKPKLAELRNLQLCYSIRCILKHPLNIVKGWPKSAIASCLIQIPLSECTSSRPCPHPIFYSHYSCTEVYCDFNLDKHSETQRKCFKNLFLQNYSLSEGENTIHLECKPLCCNRDNFSRATTSVIF